MQNKDFERYQDLQIRAVRSSALPNYSDLLSQTFQGFKPSTDYLEWLYYKNPRGKVVGFDAFDGVRLVAHYVCIPIKIQGFLHNSLLSLNTATLPTHQGRGLFRLLAERTFESAAATYANVIAVANAKSLGGFTKHLGFSSMGNLELRFGALARKFEGSRIYSKDDLIWRGSCPDRLTRVSPMGPGSYLVSVKPLKIAPEFQAIVYEEFSNLGSRQNNKLGITLDWRRGTHPKLKLPKHLKPSPLQLLFKPLLEPDSNVLTSFSFPDFDAF
jgi:hypothetical protein